MKYRIIEALAILLAVTVMCLTACTDPTAPIVTQHPHPTTRTN